jgi:NDP-sugar pyrophosphorylase family protein
VLTAIIVVGPEIREEAKGSFTAGEARAPGSLSPTQAQRAVPLVCAEVLGRSVLERMIDDLQRAGVDTISVLGDVPVAPMCDGIGSKLTVESCSTEEAWRRATQQLMSNAEGGADASLVLRLGAYLDLNLMDALQFHRERGQVITRAFELANAHEKEEPLDIWITAPIRMTDGEDILTILRSAEPARYLVDAYVNRLDDPRDLRRLVVDGLTSRCNLRPQISEIRPGVWMDEGAQVDRSTRIVAPAYIGRRSRIAEQCLITRCTNIESNCQIDYGTVVEDSSILSNTYLGVGLDISHSIVDGKSLLNLDRGVTMEIADPCVIRQNTNPHLDKNCQLTVAFDLGGA